jgi:hypothetical protein
MNCRVPDHFVKMIFVKVLKNVETYSVLSNSYFIWKYSLISLIFFFFFFEVFLCYLLCLELVFINIHWLHFCEAA